MTKKDLNYIAAVEKAITDKYGDDAVRNPKASWDDEREKEYMVAWIKSPYLIFTFERRIGWHLKNSLFILSEAKKHEYCKKDK